MQVRAVKTFSGRQGLIRAGAVVTVEQRYGEQLMRNKLAVLHTPNQLGPETNKDLGDAPERKDDDRDENGDIKNGEDDAGNEDDDSEETEGSESSRDRDSSAADSSSEDRRGAGRAKPVSSRQVARRSRKRT